MGTCFVASVFLHYHAKFQKIHGASFDFPFLSIRTTPQNAFKTLSFKTFDFAFDKMICVFFYSKLREGVFKLCSYRNDQK